MTHVLLRYGAHYPAYRNRLPDNAFHGHADKVVQLGDVHGDLTVNRAPPRRFRRVE